MRARPVTGPDVVDPSVCNVLEPRPGPRLIGAGEGVGNPDPVLAGDHLLAMSKHLPRPAGGPGSTSHRAFLGELRRDIVVDLLQNRKRRVHQGYRLKLAESQGGVCVQSLLAKAM